MKRQLWALAVAAGALWMHPVHAQDETAPGRGAHLSLSRGEVARFAAAAKLTEAAAGRQVAFEDARRQREGVAKRVLGPMYAGEWVEQDASGEPRLVVGVAGSKTGLKVQGLGTASLRRQAFSMEDLESAMKALDAYARADGSVPGAVHSWEISPKDSAVIVRARRGAAAAVQNLLLNVKVKPGLVRVVYEDEAPWPAAAGDKPFGGVLMQYGGASPVCSFGFAIEWPMPVQNLKGFLTAGHCVNGGTILNSMSGVAMAERVWSTTQGSDLAVYRFLSSVYPAPGNVAVYNSVGGHQAVTGTGWAIQGGYACKSGALTGYRCGIVESTSVTVNMPFGTLYGMTTLRACLARGDSGGPVVTPGGSALGIVVGGNIPQSQSDVSDNCWSGAARSYVQPVAGLTNALGPYQSTGLRLVIDPTCGALMAGQAMKANEDLSNCTGSYALRVDPASGQLQLRSGAGATVWAVSAGGAGSRLVMEASGNLVLRRADGSVAWQTGTSVPGSWLSVSIAGDLFVNRPMGGSAAWSWCDQNRPGSACYEPPPPPCGAGLICEIP